MRRRSVAWLATLTAMTVAGTACRPVGRVSVPTPGSASSATSAPSWAPSLSDDGKVVAFASDAGDLIGTSDTNGSTDVFARDLATQLTTRVSVATGGAQSDGASTDPAVSADGRSIAFTSTAGNLVTGDTNAAADVFVHDRTTGTTTRVSVTSAGAQGNGASTDPAVSADGRYIAFTSTAGNLVTGDTNAAADVFVHDRTTGTTTRVSVTSAGAQGNGASTEPALSGSGDWVAFTSTAANLVSGDSNGVSDVFAARRAGGTIRRASAPDPLTAPFGQSNGASASPSVIDPIGGYLGSGEPLVAYRSSATNLAGSDANGSGSDVFVSTQVLSGITRTVRVSAATSAATQPSLAAVDQGPGFVTTYTRSGASVTGGSEVVSVTRTSPLATDGLTVVTVDLNGTGTASNGASDEPAISADGTFVAFHSTSGDLDGRAQTSTAGDVYVARATPVRIDSVTPDRVGVGETKTLVVRGAGFSPVTTASFDAGIAVTGVSVVSATELAVTVTGLSSSATEPRRDLTITGGGAGGSGIGTGKATCLDCVEVASIVDQPGPVDLDIDGGLVQVGSFSLPLPDCTGSECIALPGTVDSDGNLDFGIDSLALDPIAIPVELIAGVETTIELVPRLDAPTGRVIPATGEIELRFGLAIGLRHPLLPSACAIGPVAVDLSAGPTGSANGVAYDQLTGEATLAGGFTEALAITGCGFFTSTLNSLLGLPMPIADNAVTLGLRFDPILTGTATP